MKTQSHSVSRVIRLNVAEPDESDWLARSAGRGLIHFDADRTGMQGIEDIGARPDAEPDREVNMFWSVLSGLMEGFALYGAALHPTAAMPVHAILAARKDLESQPEASEPEEPQTSARAGVGSNGNVVELDRLRPLDARAERHWNWLRSVGETVAVWSAHLRREREIRRAVAALNELDERTLRDIGIRGRAEIEWTVRYCHDC